MTEFYFLFQQEGYPILGKPPTSNVSLTVDIIVFVMVTHQEMFGENNWQVINARKINKN
jgi:hypothetical protein